MIQLTRNFLLTLQSRSVIKAPLAKGPELTESQISSQRLRSRAGNRFVAAKAKVVLTSPQSSGKGS